MIILYLPLHYHCICCWWVENFVVQMLLRKEEHVILLNGACNESQYYMGNHAHKIFLAEPCLAIKGESVYASEK